MTADLEHQRPGTDRARRGAFLGSMLVLLLALFAVVGTLRVQSNATEWVAHTREVLLQIEGTSSTLKNAESAQR